MPVNIPSIHTRGRARLHISDIDFEIGWVENQQKRKKDPMRKLTCRNQSYLMQRNRRVEQRTPGETGTWPSTSYICREELSKTRGNVMD